MAGKDGGKRVKVQDATSPADKEMAAKVNEWYSMKLPREFYALANLARKLQPLQPCAAFEGAGVQLVGPFELLLTGAFERECSPGDRASIHQHYRFPYDPPEAMTVALEVKKGKQRFSGKHWAYFRDSPDEDPAFVVTGTARCGKLDVEGDYLANVLLARCRGVRGKDEPKVAPIVAQLSGLLGKLGLREGANDRSRTRKRKVVAKTFHTLGMVCPFDRKADLGYRPLSIPGSKLKTMLDQLLAAKDTVGWVVAVGCNWFLSATPAPTLSCTAPRAAPQ